MELSIYLAGEIHSNWRGEIVQGINSKNLPIAFSSPVTDHDASDHVGEKILGKEDKAFWKDHIAAKINRLKTKNAIDKSDLVVVKFGGDYRQWNAAFDAGYAVAMGKSLITIHPADLTHALKEIDAAAMATTQTTDQVIEILTYITESAPNI
jgi:YtoQ family protein